jgi:hypothetical protein
VGLREAADWPWRFWITGRPHRLDLPPGRSQAGPLTMARALAVGLLTAVVVGGVAQSPGCGASAIEPLTAVVNTQFDLGHRALRRRLGRAAPRRAGQHSQAPRPAPC